MSVAQQGKGEFHCQGVFEVVVENNSICHFKVGQKHKAFRYWSDVSGNVGAHTICNFASLYFEILVNKVVWLNERGMFVIILILYSENIIDFNEPNIWLTQPPDLAPCSLFSGANSKPRFQ